MALFNVTSIPALAIPIVIYDFKTSNMNIYIDTIELTISELQITEQEWLGNF